MNDLSTAAVSVIHRRGGEGCAMKLTGDRCLCKTCGEHFNSTRAFDKHRTETYAQLSRRCLSPDEMRALGVSQNAAGFWITQKHRILASAHSRISGDRLDPLPSVAPLAHDRQNVAHHAASPQTEVMGAAV